MRIGISFMAFAILSASPVWAEKPQGKLPLDTVAGAKFQFDGPVGKRVEANIHNWLVRAPAANPGMLAMFELRDREPKPNIMPWAGEFVGKYLISAIQALRMSEDPGLKETVAATVKRLIASQAEDGYLGPFPKDTRLLTNWDLWGHYHAMLALMMWNEDTGDEAALRACCKAADLVCKTFLDTGRRVLSVGSDEMNLAVIHSLGRLYRKTGQTRYLAMMREIEKDWEKAGDYFRTGVAGVEYYRIPRPRWESLHDLQGLVELYQITGDDRYRRSFLHHWNSIRRCDRHNNGAFSSGEQATGNPYTPNAIETCCTIAWMAITLDALRLSGDPKAADELELATYNGMLGAQHPSGSWCTYNTPMDGAREASHHTIVFQARAGTPDLNCCSVNGPRGLGMLSEWAVMRCDGGLAINYYGPMQAQFRLDDGTAVSLTQETRYPLDGKVRIRVAPEKPVEFTLKCRIPGWANSGAAVPPGSYHEVRQTWKAGDEIALDFPMPLRYESGDMEMFGRMSVYRGPLLLAYDQRWNDFDEAQIRVTSPAQLAEAKISFPLSKPEDERVGRAAPWLLAEIPAAKGSVLRLCDFATAGSTGSRYLSWLPAREMLPPAPLPLAPADGARVAPGYLIFTLRRPPVADQNRQHTIVIAETPDFSKPVLQAPGKTGHRLIVTPDEAARLKPNVDYFWKLMARNAVGTTESLAPAKRFRIDPTLPPLTEDGLSEFGEGPDGILVAADLAGDPQPGYGKLLRGQGFKPAPGIDGKPNGSIQLDGKTGMLVYAVKAFPRSDYTVSLWAAYERKEDRLGQIFSAWDHNVDDPLRICVAGGKLQARIEAGSGWSTEGVAVEPGRWHHVAVTKSGPRLVLYLDGKPAAQTQVPPEIQSSARDFALGGNPHFTGQSEHLACRVAKFSFHVRAMSEEEIASLYTKQKPK